MTSFGYNTLGFGSLASSVQHTDANTVLLVRSDTTDGSSTFEDLSSYGHSVTSLFVDGSPRGCLHSTDDKKMGASSIESTAVLNHLYVPAHSSFAFGSGNWTVEFWIKPASTDGNAWYWEIFNGRAGANQISMYRESSTIIRATLPANTNFAGLAAGYDSTTAFHHYAMVRNGDNLNVYADGVVSTTTVNVSGTSFFDGSSPSITIFGRNTQASADVGPSGTTGGQSIRGYMDEFKISNVARYTGNFTPSGAFDYGLT
tara:strand:- start:349 stop:1122 length:774 start_codon:yes stop_codon:yes gene_type:complete